jgi:hypothetical protein
LSGREYERYKMRRRSREAVPALRSGDQVYLNRMDYADSRERADSAPEHYDHERGPSPDVRCRRARQDALRSLTA